MSAGGMSKAQQRRQRKMKGYYEAQRTRTVANKKRKMRRHIRNHPNDAPVREQYERNNFGRADTFGMTAKGKKRVKRAESRARRQAA